jgi:subtilisin family serine protease
MWPKLKPAILALFALVLTTPGFRSQAAPAHLDSKLQHLLANDFDSSLKLPVLIRYKSGAVTSRLIPLSRAQTFALMKESSQKTEALVMGSLTRSADVQSLWIAHGTLAQLTAQEIQKITLNPLVASVQMLGRTVRLIDDQPGEFRAPAGNFAYGLEKIRIPELRAQDPARDGHGVRVGILDTGIDPSHPALAGRVALFKDFIANQMTPYDDHGHGTHVAGTIAGSIAQGLFSSEFIGVAPGAQLVIGKVFSQSGSFDDKTLLLGMQWMANPDGNFADAPQVVSNSWVVEADPQDENPGDDPFCAAVESWVQLGIIPVFAAGNAGPNRHTVGIPAACPAALAVAATDEQDHIFDLSSRGPAQWKTVSVDKPNVSAPGVDIDSAGLNGGIAVKSGTSMAAPHVAGALALLLQGRSRLDSAKAIQALLEGAAPLSSGAMNSTVDPAFGVGRIDVVHSVELMK